MGLPALGEIVMWGFALQGCCFGRDFEVFAASQLISYTTKVQKNSLTTKKLASIDCKNVLRN